MPFVFESYTSILNPQLTLQGQTLPQAQQGVAYTATVSTLASGGVPPYAFSLLSSTGPDVWNVNSIGVVSGTPVVEVFRVDNNGNYRTDNNKNVRGAFP